MFEILYFVFEIIKVCDNNEISHTKIIVFVSKYSRKIFKLWSLIRKFRLRATPFVTCYKVIFNKSEDGKYYVKQYWSFSCKMVVRLRSLTLKLCRMSFRENLSINRIENIDIYRDIVQLYFLFNYFLIKFSI